MLSIALVGVYRSRNAEHIRELCKPAAASGWTIAWWALDHVVEELAEFTVGSGPGARLPLLNRILRELEHSPDWLLVCDDDVMFEHGDVVALRDLCEKAALDLGQPARADLPLAHPITARQRFSVARRTSFVEIGPLFVVGPAWRERIVPFPEERGMGWGLELEWLELERQGCTLGIVDAIRIRHVGAVGADYDWDSQLENMHKELAARGLDSWSDVQTTYETWRPWERKPRWRARAAQTRARA